MRLNTKVLSPSLIPLLLLLIIYLAIRIPNFYIVFQSPYFLSHTIARGLIIVLSLLQVKKLLNIRFSSPTFTYITLYLLGVSLSIINAVNLGSFFTVYKDIIFTLLLFFNVFVLVEQRQIKMILTLFSVFTVLALLMEVLILLIPSVILPFANSILHESYLQFFQYQYGRGRLFGDSLNEAFIPLVVLTFIKGRERVMSILILLFAVISAITITFISGWRTKLIICLFACILSIAIFYSKKMKAPLLSLFAIIVIALTALSFLSSGIKITSSFERLFNIDGPELQENISRTNYLKDAFEIGGAAPLFGVGLGNYYDVLLQTAKNSSKNDAEDIYKKKFIAVDDPHNLLLGAFASTGFVGLLALILLLLRFAYIDVSSFRSLTIEGRALVVTFWGIFIYSFFNPWLYFQYLALFWFIRGMIEKIHYFNFKK